VKASSRSFRELRGITPLWWARLSMAALAAVALVVGNVVPASGPAFAAVAAESPEDREAREAAAAPPETADDEDGNWFTDLFGGDDDPQLSEVPADAELLAEPQPAGTVVSPSDGWPAVTLDAPRTIHATGAELKWSPYDDPSTARGDDIVEYQVHRSVSRSFSPSRATLVAPVKPATTTFTDTTAVPPAAGTPKGHRRTYAYMIAVKRADGDVVPGRIEVVRLPEAGRIAKVTEAASRTALTLDATPGPTFYAPGTPSRMRQGASTSVDLTLSNATESSWTASGQRVRASWTATDGSSVGTPVTAALPEDMSPGESVTIPVTITAPPTSDGQKRSDVVLTWSMESTGQASAGTLALPADPMKQNVAIEDPTSDQLGLESFFTYAGKNTGAGATVMNNVAAGNAVWSYDILSNPGRGLSTFARIAYNSQDVSDTVLGNGWSAQISGPIRLGAPLGFHPNPRPTEILLPDGDGTTHVFRLDEETGEWQAPAGVNYRLTQLADDAAVHCPSDRDYEPEAWEMLRPDGTRFNFGCDGYLTSVVDKNGNTQTFTYEARQSNNQPRKFLTYLTDPSGRDDVLRVEYWRKGQEGFTYADDVTGDLVRDTGQLSNAKIYDHVRSLTDVSGRRVEFYYTEQGNLGQVVDGAGTPAAKEFRFVYETTQGGKNVKLAKVTDPRGNATELDYYLPSEGDDPKDHWELQTVTDRLGHDTSFDYMPHPTNDDWWSSTVTDAENHTTRYTSDDFGRPRSVTNALDQTVSLTWDQDNNVRTLTEANGAVTSYCYDPLTGYPVWERDAEQNDAHGGPPAESECVPGESAADAPDGAQVMEYRTWEDGHVAQIHRTTSPAGRMNEFGYDAVANLLTVTDGKGVVTPTEGDHTTSYTYDEHGQLATATDANGNTTKYRDYVPAGYPETTEDALGAVSTTVYDARGLVLETRDPLDGVITQSYDVFGRPLEGTRRKSADEAVVTPAPTWDPNDNVISLTAPNGAVTTTTYDRADQAVERSAPKFDPDGDPRISTYAYDAAGNLIRTTEPKGNLTPEIPDDYTTHAVYDAIYQHIRTTDAEGGTSEYVYDLVGNVIETRDAVKVASPDESDFTARTEYDLNHRIVATIDAAGNRTRSTYDADGNVISATDPAGFTAYVTYDERGDVVESKAPYDGTSDGTVTYRTTKYEYDQVGNSTRVVSPRGAATADADDFATRTEYDALNRPVRQYLPYDPADSRYNDPDVFTETTYDAAGRVVKTSLPPSEGQSVRNDSTTEYFDNGWIKKSTDQWNITTEFEYNDLGQQTSRTLRSADGSSTRTMSWSYFPDGRLQAKSDDGVPVGSNISLVDNSDAQLTSESGTWTDATSGDEQGYDHTTHETVSGTSPDEFTWTLDVPSDGTYDLAVTYPQVSGAATEATYTLTHGQDEVSEPSVTVDQSTRAGAWVELGSYDLEAGEPVTLSLAASTTGVVVADGVRLSRDNSQDVDTEQHTFAYSHDPNGNMTGINDTSSGARADEYTITYDGLNQVETVREALAGEETDLTRYSYDATGRTTGISTADQVSHYTYDDPRQLLTEVSVDDLTDDAAARLTRYTYGARGETATEVKGNGNTVTYDYLAGGALGSAHEETRSGDLVASHEYTYDENGNPATDIAEKADADDSSRVLATTTTYTYDPVDRLAQAVRAGHGAGTETYVHDDNANVVSEDVKGVETTYAYDRNRLQSSSTTGATPTAFNYDPFGRQVSSVSAGNTISRSTYDGFDHVVRSERADPANPAAGLTATTYEYDPLDRTTSTTTSDGETTGYAYLGLSNEVLSEDVDGELSKSYQYAPSGQRLSQVTHQADPDEDVEAGEAAYYGYNAHTDVETLTDNTGDTIGTYGYTAYGSDDTDQFTGIDAPGVGDPADTRPYNSYRYNSKRWDGGSGTYDMGFRDYDPGLNRFTTRDMYNGALADLGLGTDPYTGNRYAFASGNPTSGIEMDGHFAMAALLPALPVLGAIPVAGWIAAAVIVAVVVVAVVVVETRDNTTAREEDDAEPAPTTAPRPVPRPVPTETDDDDDEQKCEAGDPDYGNLDSEGRATGVTVCLDSSNVSGGTPASKQPAGYQWAKGFARNTLGIADTRGAINACHLLGSDLGGDGGMLENLATCARGANAKDNKYGGTLSHMRFYESLVRGAVDSGQTVLYSVTPLYDGNRTVPYAFEINAQGFRDDGQPGIVINGVIIQNELNGQNLGRQSSGGSPVPLAGTP
jgi:RHS repeat-associated protein